eukprot:CAMPEP_0113382070 /NCGR_PEP_ID=MMETSP0013_2-20120614/5641_1 /TAXON_ID=2843 ORGANISM="Skeletonema costatum, Strain 1716" /NCGR_SAMPLE_ID=MMETSP0013_2 /ASSEMBLY_ACC=CAM_ASM_000158 /LENGTH=746 /DNA_ID=CAMNT_0000264543 /DNA_START=228 /DNA_END=2465 /DNA_ORIENTATION=- /assembly_acc=CAM_ASM_000158
MSTPKQYLSLPEVLMSLVESYLPPSDCAHLSATSTCLHQRWTARRWHRTFQLHYGRGSQIIKKERLTKLRKCREIVECLLIDQGPNGVRYAEIHHWLAKYGELYKDGWTLTFVGCCHDINFPCECKHSASSCSMSCSKSGCNLHTDMQRHQQTSPRYGHEDSLDDGAASTTRFNVPALVPSVQRAYVDLWDTIELSFLGYYDAEREARTRNLHPVPSIMRTVRASVLPELAEYLYFVVGFKPLARGGLVSRRRGRDGGVMGPMISRNNTGINTSAATTIEEIDSLRNTATTMSAWKLASILRERGVGCLRCSICDCIDLVGDDIEEDSMDSINEERGVGERGPHSQGDRRSPFLREFQERVGGSQAWITPCRCPELVHRQCLERKLGLVPKYEPWERLKVIGANLFLKKRHSTQSAQGDQFYEPLSNSFAPRSATNHEYAAPRVWISYDSTIPRRRRPGDNEFERENATIAIDELGQFRSPDASCEMCGGRYLRSVRLPRSRAEVVAASLSDPLSVVRALSTLIHFILKCLFLAAIEGICSDESCDSHRTLLNTPLGSLKWPTTGLNGVALVMWQLQQCCMLHIFFSRRFAAIIDRLWMGPISLFYCRLYFYFVVTSAILTMSFIPAVSRNVRLYILEPLMGQRLLELLQPIGDAIALINLLQYAISSTTVICIFWRTNYRIFTVANGKEAAANLRRRQDLTRHLQHDNGVLEVNRAGAAGRNHARIDGVGPGDTNAASHPLYHGP